MFCDGGSGGSLFDGKTSNAHIPEILAFEMHLNPAIPGRVIIHIENWKERFGLHRLVMIFFVHRLP
jgi:hypothetical protein